MGKKQLFLKKIKSMNKTLYNLKKHIVQRPKTISMIYLFIIFLKHIILLQGFISRFTEAVISTGFRFYA